MRVFLFFMSISLGETILQPVSRGGQGGIGASSGVTSVQPLHLQPVADSLHPLVQPIDDLSSALGGRGKAKNVWSMLRLGLDPLTAEHPDESSKLSTKARASLAKATEGFSLLTTSVTTVTTSPCGTVKFLQSLQDGSTVESVLIPNYKFGRTTICVSTQVGCDRGCRFCATGKMGLSRSLRADEVVSQVAHGRRLALSTVGMPELTNVVYMGMGDAGENLEAVGESVIALTDHERMQMARSKVTVSTVGGDPSVFGRIGEREEQQDFLSGIPIKLIIPYC